MYHNRLVRVMGAMSQLHAELQELEAHRNCTWYEYITLIETLPIVRTWGQEQELTAARKAMQAAQQALWEAEGPFIRAATIHRMEQEDRA